MLSKIDLKAKQFYFISPQIYEPITLRNLIE